MKKRMTSLALVLILIAALIVPVSAAEVTPAGFTLFRLSEASVQGYVTDIFNFLVVEDGTLLTCPDAEMRVTRYDMTKAGEYGFDALNMYLTNYTSEDMEPRWEVSTQTLPAVKKLAIEGNAVYIVNASIVGVSEELQIINRSTMMANLPGEESVEMGASYNIDEHKTPSGVQRLAGFDHILTTTQPLGYGYLCIEGPDYPPQLSDVHCIFPENTMVYAPEGFYFSGGFMTYDLELGGWNSFGVTGGVLASSNGDSYVSLCAYGKRYAVESLNLVWSGFGGENEYNKWSLVRLSEEQLTSRYQCASTWAVEQLNQVIDAGLMTFGDYKNLQNCTCRREFAALVVRLYETVTGKAAPMPETNPFEDYPDENMLKAYALGVINGVSGTEIAPEAALTREQAATMLVRLANLLGYELPKHALTFDDTADVSAWAAGAVGSMNAAGIMNGVGGNRFDPKGVFSCEQAALTVMRMYELVK